MQNTKHIVAAGLMSLALAGAGRTPNADAAVSVNLNGQPLATRVAPVIVRNSTLVPMRDIFEALGATVQWNELTQGITAQKDNSKISLQIGNSLAVVNGQRVRLQQPAMLYGGATMVPLRFVSEALGANVNWNGNQELVSISLPMTNTGTVIAMNPGTTTPVTPPALNGNVPAYNAPAYQAPAAPIYNGPVYNAPVTVPAPSDLNTGYNPPANTNMPDDTAATSGEEVAGVRTIRVPRGVLVPVSLDQKLSSETSRVGDTFTATVVSQRLGDSEFPAGSKLQGRVVEVQERNGDQPGVLGLEFNSVIFPNGDNQRLEGQLASLDKKDVTQMQGRIMAKGGSRSRGQTLKIVGIGAGVGYVLGRVLDKGTTATTVIGAAGGFLYDRLRNKRASEATLKEGTRLGVRLDDPVAYADASGYSEYRLSFLRM